MSNFMPRTRFENSYVRGAARIVVADETYYDLIDTLDDIFEFDEGPTQFDLRLGFYDIGFTKTGVLVEDGYIKTQISELNTVTDMVVQFGSRPLLIFAFQLGDKRIRAYIFPDSALLPIDLPLDWRRGEATSIPVTWAWPGYGRIIERMP